MKLTERKWLIFKVGDLFVPQRGSLIGLKKNNLVEGTRIISATTKNNGFVGFVDDEPEFEGNVFTIANTGQGSVGLVFYHEEPFIPTNNITVLTPKFNLARNIAMFILPLFKKERYRVSFGRILNEKRIEEYPIKLPIDQNQNPDWSFMENYVSDIVNKISKVSITKKPFHSQKLMLTDRQWKYFRYDDDLLFSVEKDSNVRVRDISPNGTTPLVSALKHSNGVSGMINIEPHYEGNMIVVIGNGNAGVGEAFYHPNPFCATIDVNILKPKFELNQFIALFLVTLIRKERFRYSFGRKWLPPRMKKSLIKLPITSNGNPDWQFMENYIKSLLYSGSLK